MGASVIAAKLVRPPPRQSQHHQDYTAIIGTKPLGQKGEERKKASVLSLPQVWFVPRTPSKRHTDLLGSVAKTNKTQQGPILAPAGSINQPLGAVGGTLVLIVTCLTWLFEQQSFCCLGWSHQFHTLVGLTSSLGLAVKKIPNVDTR